MGKVKKKNKAALKQIKEMLKHNNLEIMKADAETIMDDVRVGDCASLHLSPVGLKFTIIAKPRNCSETQPG